MSDYDVIVIGAGNAGLTAATTLARGGARTLLVERHNIPGGCATSFRRGRFEFEVALHQLSGIGTEGQPMSLRGLLERLGVADKLEFVEEHELYRTVVPGELDVTLPATWEGAIEAIEAAFPGNREALERFFELCRQVAVWRVMAQRADGDEAMIEQLRTSGETLLANGLRPTAAVLDDHFDDQRVKYVLASYWGYLGQPPSSLPFMDLAILLFAYFEYKPFHIRGGSQMLSSALLDSYHQAGGESLFNTAVEQILTRDGTVVGVRLDDGEELTADTVVANVSPALTYGRMIDDPGAVPEHATADLRSRRLGPSAFVLHMGLDATPQELGLTVSTSFVATDLDEDRLAASTHSLEPARVAGLTCYDVEPIGFSPSGASHLSLLTLQYGDAWEQLPPDRYAGAKFAFAESLLDLGEILAPGLREAIEEVDVATPLTIAHYLGHPGGAIYGFDQDATEGWLFRDAERIEVPGLHHTGAWTGLGGFQPTLEGGARVARQLLTVAA